MGATASTRSPTASGALSPSASPRFLQPRSSGGVLSSKGSISLDEEDEGDDKTRGGRTNDRPQQAEPRGPTPSPRSGTTLDDLTRRLAQVQLMGHTWLWCDHLQPPIPNHYPIAGVWSPRQLSLESHSGLDGCAAPGEGDHYDSPR